MNISTVSVGFLGAGRMATALARGFVESGGLAPARVVAVDPSDAACEAFGRAVGPDVSVQTDVDAILKTDLLILAVKPQVLPAVLEDLATKLNPPQLVVSIAAGISLSKIEEKLPEATRVIRVMPNTPCLVGFGACGVSTGINASSEDVRLVCDLLATVGIVEVIPENLMDALTGLSGSGPAYAFQMIEALSDGGVKMGLPRSAATRLAAQTLLGAAQMVLETGEHPGQLKDAVTSPGGTTIAGIQALEAGGLRAALMNAVQAASERSVELG